jgi:hypothetical protein
MGCGLNFSYTLATSDPFNLKSPTDRIDLMEFGIRNDTEKSDQRE